MDAEKHVLTDVPVMEISLEADAYPEANVLEISTIAGQVVTDGEKSKAWKKQAKAPSAKLLSQYSQRCHVELSVDDGNDSATIVLWSSKGR
ncbi:uncharacterized protein LOC108811829 isoform X2 [Raphanus sativus]|uniref:Uncharacterized protein LOC108811829 isoform X2 n=1 Tax=Raphanus sativus TaxID=3726 RepID=A0A9W3CAS7_RAPSA|nr:uncharacterized protein LOC108811829 isoform X2 [Raphanus sativus]